MRATPEYKYPSVVRTETSPLGRLRGATAKVHVMYAVRHDYVIVCHVQSAARAPPSPLRRLTLLL